MAFERFQHDLRLWFGIRGVVMELDKRSESAADIDPASL